jgi:glyoxylase-like metal-dependent hydrolase (beta-lactamase superfamily II)
MTEETAMSEMDSVEAAAPPAPVVTADPVEIADGVYVIPDGRVPLVPNVGIVLGDRAALVVDTGMGPTSGARVLEHARALAGDRPLLLTVTHFHPEHGFGAQAFEGSAVVVYNTAQRDELRQKGEAYIQMFRGFGDSVAEQLVDVRLVDPHVTYDGPSAEIQLGVRTARLLTWGRAHTGGDQVVLLPEESIVFGGDLFETRMFPIVPYFPPDDTDVDGHRWIEVLEELERLDPAIVVPGHGDVGGPELIATAREYLELLRDETARLADEGATEDDLAAELDRSLRALHPDWAQPEWIAFGARCFYTAYTREPAARS